MLPSNGKSLRMVQTLIRSICLSLFPLKVSASLRCQTSGHARSFYHVTSHKKQDQRSRLSRLWAPSGGIVPVTGEDAHSKLLRAGFLRQAHPGIFHMLPLGYRVQEKIERLIDRHMYTLGASKLDLSSISSQDLWTTSGRLQKANSELFLLRDRNDTGYLLSPTHEEEITSLVANAVKSYKELPARLYQISRKYRDELRPRHGLLRSREFIMKDLYTFDRSKSLALDTYGLVCKSYAALFNELKIPYLVAEADSGDMGGNLSHEFHFLTSKGEDRVVSCQSCDYVANEEVARSALPAKLQAQQGEVMWSFLGSDQPMPAGNTSPNKAFSVWRGISRDRKTLVNVWYASPSRSSIGTAWPEINTHAVKRVFPDLDPSVQNAVALWKPEQQPSTQSEANQTFARPGMINLIDYRLPRDVLEEVNPSNRKIPIWPESVTERSAGVLSSIIFEDPSTHEHLDLLQIQKGDTCPKCGKGQLDVHVAIEVGHTFFLGTRYSEPFNAVVALPSGHLEEDSNISGSTPQLDHQVLMQMGCHGIGVSRMIGAVAEILSDEKGLNWPRLIAPYEVVVVPTQGNELDAVFIFDALANQNSVDVVIDDRKSVFSWKMKDADLIGYPVIVVVGRDWKIDRTCEVQCRRLSVRENIPFERLPAFVEALLVKL